VGAPTAISRGWRTVHNHDTSRPFNPEQQDSPPVCLPRPAQIDSIHQFDALRGGAGIERLAVVILIHLAKLVRGCGAHGLGRKARAN